ncbi:MAG: peptide chain release factor N(5)-glutamine methyltransferase [Eubacteriales bacterium]|nr:peptide chain release factor N(5)-glutamine methyltransferase [Eubacteriales bacterium]
MRINGNRINLMTIREALETGIRKLKKAEIEDAALDACVILCGILDSDKAYVYAHPEFELSEGDGTKYTEAINARFEGMPVSYITGKKEFMSLEFKVGPGVLIPRPETELLAETAILCISKKQEAKSGSRGGISVLDMCTGSGCLAVSIARYCSRCKVTAADILPEAVKTAKINAIKNNVENRVEILISDLFSELSGRKFDFILSNPPYVSHDDLPGLKNDIVCYEPNIALDGGREGLDHIKAIISEAPPHLNNGGMLALEIGKGQYLQVTEYMREYFNDIKIKKDLSGIPRVVSGVKL